MRIDHVALRVPDIGESIDWWCSMVPGARVLYRDPTWGLIEAGGARVAFVLAEQHPDHLAWRVDDAELSRLASEHGVEIATHRDGSRSIYITAPGDHALEVIAYPAS